MPHTAAIEFPRNWSSTWRLRSLFEANVAGPFPALLQHPRKCSRTRTQALSQSEKASVPLPPAAIVARPCNNRVARQEDQPVDIASLLRSDRCTVVLPTSSKSPGNSRKKRRAIKKTRVATPSRAKSPAKRRFPVHQTSPGCAERISKRWQMGGKIARPGAKR